MPSARCTFSWLSKRLLILVFGVGLLWAPEDADAQNRRATERAFVASPAQLGMGDVGVALPGRSTPLFYNPAHFSRTDTRISLVGVQGAVSENVRNQIEFYDEQVDPAVQAQFDLPVDDLRGLYNDAFSLGRTPTRAHGTVLLPSFAFSRGGIGFGAGAFLQSEGNYRFTNAGLGIPNVSLVSRSDFILTGGAGVDLTRVGINGLSVGATAKFTRRYLSVKDKPLDTFSTDESALLLDGTSLGLDLGFQYALGVIPGPGRWSVAGVLYDALASDFGYSYYGTPADLPIIGGRVGGSDALTEQEVALEVERARAEHELAPSYRLGAAYALDRVLFLKDVGLALDYQGYRDAQVDQNFWAHVHLGARARVIGPLRLRAGLNQGYPSGGLGLNFRVVTVDYALVGHEEGRLPGQLSSYQHLLQVGVHLR